VRLPSMTATRPQVKQAKLVYILLSPSSALAHKCTGIRMVGLRNLSYFGAQRRLQSLCIQTSADCADNSYAYLKHQLFINLSAIGVGGSYLHAGSGHQQHPVGRGQASGCWDAGGCSGRGSAQGPAAGGAGPGDLRSFKPQEGSNSLWALAKLHAAGRQAGARPAVDPEACEALAQQAVGSRGQAASKRSTSARRCQWGWATLQSGGCVHHHAELFRSLGQQARAVKHQQLPQALANIVWAHAVAHDAAGTRVEASATQLLPVLEDLAEAAVASIAGFNEQNLANIAWASAKMRYRHQRLLDALAARLQAAQLSAQQVVNALYGLARLGQTLPPGASQQLEQQVPAMSTQLVCHSCWALAVALAAEDPPAESCELRQQLATRVRQLQQQQPGCFNQP
jgi:hypothetical protein